MISQNQAHEYLEKIKKDLPMNEENYAAEEIEFIEEFSFIGIENHWFSFEQLEKIEKIYLEHGMLE